MRKHVVSLVTAGTLLIGGGGAAEASAASLPTLSGAITAGAPAMGANTHGFQATTAGFNSSGVKHSASVMHARRGGSTRLRTRRRSRAGGIVKTLAFLFIGLPLLIILALVLFFMMRRARKQRERAMQQQYAQQNTQAPGQWQSGHRFNGGNYQQPGGPGVNDPNNPNNRF